MIGGAMLACAVGAMILLAFWSMMRDDAPDSLPRDGILALKRPDAPAKKSRGPRPRRGQSPRPAPRRQMQSDPEGEPAHGRATVRKPRALALDPREMALIADEAEATLPEFIRNSREEY